MGILKMSLALNLTTKNPLTSKVSLVNASPDAAARLVNSKKVNKVDYPHLMVIAEQIASSNSHVKAATTNKLQAIADQIKRLQQEAVKCLEEAKRDKQLHEAACNLVKKSGYNLPPV